MKKHLVLALGLVLGLGSVVVAQNSNGSEGNMSNGNMSNGNMSNGNMSNGNMGRRTRTRTRTRTRRGSTRGKGKKSGMTRPGRSGNTNR